MKKNNHLTHIGQMIRRMREYRGISQEQLAEAASLRRATITDIELGKSNFEVNTLVAIASALGCELDVSLNLKVEKNLDVMVIYWPSCIIFDAVIHVL